MALVAKSKTKGVGPGRGQPKAMGLVPNTGWWPPAGATQAWLGVSASAARPCAVMASISGHSAEKWKQCWMTSAPRPCVRAASTRAGRPRSKASGEKA